MCTLLHLPPTRHPSNLLHIHLPAIFPLPPPPCIAIMLHRHDDKDGALAQLMAFRELASRPQEAERLAGDPEVQEQAAALEKALRVR